MAWLHIPDDVIRAILSWLPVNSLLRFKWVSKQWLRLITNPDTQFLKLHLNRLFRSKPGILVVTKTHDKATQTLFDYAQHYTSPNNLTRFALPSSHSTPYDYRVVNICNGLICFTDFFPEHDTKVYVWNPITGDHITIPPSPVPSYLIPHDFPGYDRFRQVDVLYGFGFYPSTTTTTHVYKVIKFVSASPHVIGGDCDSHVTLYTLGRTSSWKILPKIPYRITPDNPSTALLNGILHWFGPMLSESLGLNSPKKILIAFDMQADTFHQISQPRGISSELTKKVGVLDGLLSIFCSIEDSHNLDIEIWVMDKYGVVDSWRKVFKVAQPGVRGRWMALLGAVDSRDVIVSRNTKELFLCDLKTNSLTDLHTFDSNRESDVSETHLFKGSLLSPTIINGASRPAT